ncbi:MAG: hypothetical protein ACQESZ_10455 [Bacteroidota bacterium]
MIKKQGGGADMESNDNNLFREAIKRTILTHRGDSGESEAIADAAVTTWLAMTAQLEPVLGFQGVNVLFRRAIYVTKTTFPDLVISNFNEESVNLIPDLKAYLAGCEATDALEAACILLETFTKLLAALIGESLTSRLLSKAWTPGPQ